VTGLAAVGITARSSREPGGSPGAEAIRRLLLEGETERWDALGEALLIYAARRDHLARTVEPALAQGIWVVCDRFADSTLAYQGYARGLPLETLRRLHRLVLGDFGPDLTLILDLPVEEGLRRAALRPGAADRFERLGRDFHDKLHRGYREIAAADQQRCALINASGDVEEVHRAIVAAIAARLGVSFAR
jgi:dTMP kinase